VKRRSATAANGSDGLAAPSDLIQRARHVVAGQHDLRDVGQRFGDSTAMIRQDTGPLRRDVAQREGIPAQAGLPNDLIEVQVVNQTVRKAAAGEQRDAAPPPIRRTAIRRPDSRS